MTIVELRSFMDSKGVSDKMIVGSSLYALPTLDFVVSKLYPSFVAWLKEEKTNSYQLNTWDCKAYAQGMALWAKLSNVFGQSGVSGVRADVAFGWCFTTVADPLAGVPIGAVHAINMFVTLELDGHTLWRMEPQNGLCESFDPIEAKAIFTGVI